MKRIDILNSKKEKTQNFESLIKRDEAKLNMLISKENCELLAHEQELENMLSNPDYTIDEDFIQVHINICNQNSRIKILEEIKKTYL